MRRQLHLGSREMRLGSLLLVFGFSAPAELAFTDFSPVVDVGSSPIVSQAFRFVQMAPMGFFVNDTEQRVAAEEFWPEVHDICLSDSDWSFASAFQVLSQSVLAVDQVADFDLPFLYNLPGDLIRIREVGTPGVTRWRQDDGVLRCNQSAPLRIRYTSRVTDPALLPASYKLALALAMAVRLGPRWLGREENMYALEGTARKALLMARAADAREASQAKTAPRDDRWADDADDYDWARGATG